LGYVTFIKICAVKIKSINPKILLNALVSFCMISLSAPCLAGESGMPVCPDLHQHEEVLRDGQQYLDQNKANGYSTPGGQGYAEGGAIFDSRYYEAQRENKFVADLSKLKFDSEDALSEANRMANLCLFMGRFSEAYDLAKRVSRAYDSEIIRAKPNDIADSVRTMIRCRLISGCENLDEVKRYSSYWMLCGVDSIDDSRVRKVSIGYDEIIYLNLTTRIESDHSANPAWNEALLLNERLNHLHFDKPTEGSLACLIALLLEWNNQIDEAHKTLLSVDEFNPTVLVQNAIIGFCQRNDDFAVLKHLESKMVQNPKEQSIAILRLYLTKDHCSEARQLFRNLVSEYRASSRSSQGIMLNAVHDAIKCLEDQDEPVLKNFLVTVLEQNYFSDNGWILRILTESEKKWKSFPVETYKEYTRQDRKQTPGPLRQFALYFASKGDYATSLEAQSAVVGSIDRTTKIWENLDQRFASLAQAKSDLNAPWMMGSEQGRILRKKVELSLSAISAEHEKRECLEVAAKLDETASQLESRDLFHKAEEMHRESLDIKIRNLGPNNPEILSSLNGLARTLSVQKKYKEADAAYQKALAFYNANKRIKDRAYANVLESYAQMLVCSGQKTRADKVYEESRAFYRQMDTAHY
jgi:tetratricopeptide (TPR) repeat protein